MPIKKNYSKWKFPKWQGGKATRPLANTQKVVRKAAKRDLKTLAMHLRKGERSISYKGQALPPVLHTKMMLNYIDEGVSLGQTLQLNSLYNCLQQTGTPAIYPGWYHNLLSQYLYSNYAVYRTTVELTVWPEGTSGTFANPFYVVFFDASEQDATSITSYDQCVIIPGSKVFSCNSYGSGYKNVLKCKRTYNMVDYMNNAYDSGYGGQYNASPANNIWTQVLFFDATSGAIMTSANVSLNWKIIFDVSLAGLRYPSNT